ncbi:MAG: terminase family protein [Pseudomonadota bacterium]
MLERISPFQQSVLEAPEGVNLALLGARGGGKTIAAVALAALHLQEHGPNASVLIVRRTLRALSDFEDDLLRLITSGFSFGSHSYNRAEKILRWNGGSITLAAIERTADYDKLQGKNFTLLIVEEITQHSSEKVLRLLRSNLRAPDGVPTRVVYVGNPGGPLHGRIFERHIKNRRDHEPYHLKIDGTEAQEPWITIKSGPADNPFIDQQAYIRRLREACHGDPVRLQQWLFGDWTRGEGLMWPMFDPEVHVIKWDHHFDRDKFDTRVGIDFGISAPSVGHLGIRAKRDLTFPDGRILPRDSVIVVDEVTDVIWTEDNLNTSSEWQADRLAERVANMCANYGVRQPSGVVDNQRGLQGDDVLQIMQQTGQFWSLSLPKKGRRAERWTLMGSMLAATIERSNRPHLYISNRCRFLIHALANSVRDERDPDDVADTPHCPDHPLDACTYMLAEQRVQRATIRRTVGL